MNETLTEYPTEHIIEQVFLYDAMTLHFEAMKNWRVIIKNIP